MRAHHTVISLMTPFPYSISVTGTVAEAASMMEERGFHHLPVKDGEKLVGIINAHDVAVARKVRAEGAPSAPISVRSAARAKPFVVDINDPLEQVVRGMAERRAEATLVTRKGRLAGIITSTDVAHLLADLVAETNPSPPSDETA